MAYTASYPNCQTFLGATGAGYLPTLNTPSQNLALFVRDEWYVRAQIYQSNLPPGSSNPTPAAPAVSPAQAAGTPTAQGWKHMKAGDIYILPTLPAGAYYSTVEAWCVTGSDLDLNGGT